MDLNSTPHKDQRKRKSHLSIKKKILSSRKKSLKKFKSVMKRKSILQSLKSNLEDECIRRSPRSIEANCNEEECKFRESKDNNDDAVTICPDQNNSEAFQLEANTSPKTDEAYVYVESSTSGRFFRYKLSTSQCQLLFDQACDTDKFQCKETMNINADLGHSVYKQTEFYHIIFHGLMAGYSIQTLYEACVQRTNVEFLFEYSRLAKESNRFYFLISTLCFTCIILQLIKEAPMMNRSHHRIRITILITTLHFFTLVTVLYTTHLDSKFYFLFQSSLETDNVYNDKIINSHIDINISLWKALSILRSICCMCSWILSFKLMKNTPETSSLKTFEEEKANKIHELSAKSPSSNV